MEHTIDWVLHAPLEELERLKPLEILEKYQQVYDACIGKPDFIRESNEKLIGVLNNFPPQYTKDERLMRIQLLSEIFRYPRRRLLETTIYTTDPFEQHGISPIDPNVTLKEILSRRIFPQD